MKLQRVVLTGLLLVAYGCSGINLKAERWVERNTFYSSKLPGIAISVEEQLTYDSTSKERGRGTTWDETQDTAVETDYYYFSNQNQSIELTIALDTLKKSRWHMEPPDYSQFPNLISTGTKTLAGSEYRTAIFSIKDGPYTSLIKVYGRVSGRATTLQIFYINNVEKEWSKPPASFTDQELIYLEEFSQRADSSFSIRKYRDRPTPTNTPVMGEGQGLISTQKTGSPAPCLS